MSHVKAYPWRDAALNLFVPLGPWVQLSLLKSQQGAPESVEAPEDLFEWGRGYRIRMDKDDPGGLYILYGS